MLVAFVCAEKAFRRGNIKRMLSDGKVFQLIHGLASPATTEDTCSS